VSISLVVGGGVLDGAVLVISETLDMTVMFVCSVVVVGGVVLVGGVTIVVCGDDVSTGVTIGWSVMGGVVSKPVRLGVGG